MISKLADMIYSKSIRFKQYDEKNLFYKKNRSMLRKELTETKELVENLILRLRDNPNYSSDYLELSLFMYKTLEECITLFTDKSKNYKKRSQDVFGDFTIYPKHFFI